VFCWPCISINPCNKNQLDALFIPGLFRQSTSTCFVHVCSSSSRGILYIYNNFVRVVLFSWLSVGRPTDSQLKNTTVNWKAQHVPIVVYIQYNPDDGLQICPKHVEVDWRNKLRINSASSWFLSSLLIYWVLHCMHKHRYACSKRKGNTVRQRQVLHVSRLTRYRAL
jgi:hypothetical protein